MLGYQDGEDSDSDAGEVEVGMSLLATWEAHGSHVGSSLMRQCVHDSALCLLQTNRHVAQQAECFTNAPIFVKPTKNGRAVLLVAIYQCKSFLTTLPHQLLCGWVVY